MQSCVLPEVEALNLKEDHTPVKLEAQFCKVVSDAPYVDTTHMAIGLRGLGLSVHAPFWCMCMHVCKCLLNVM